MVAADRGRDRLVGVISWNYHRPVEGTQLAKLPIPGLSLEKVLPRVRNEAHKLDFDNFHYLSQATVVIHIRSE
jgi:hypothetical protein